ncbi:MAG: hypothetical protein Kow0069_19440 [Promethearchaeota archaeon]
MTVTNEQLRRKYLREELLPTIFCPGCGVGTVLNLTLRAIDELGFPIEDYAFVSGIGCSSRVVGYIDADTVHTTHGRAIPFATGIKLTNPRLRVVVFSGDGDLVGIGGNHFIHAIRRNVDLAVVVLNNFTYGMTGGQVSPTTPDGSVTPSHPWGNPETPFDVARLAAAAGAPYVARWTTAHPVQAKNSVKKAILKRGLSVVEVLVPCPTNFGRRNSLSTAGDFHRWFLEHSVRVDDAGEQRAPVPGACLAPPGSTAWPDVELVVGEYIDAERPTYSERYARVCENALLAHRRGRGPVSPSPGGPPANSANSAKPDASFRGKLAVRFCGLGGQGAITAAFLLGDAAVRAGLFAVQTQSYGAEARGTAATSDVLISGGGPVHFPAAEKLDALVCLAQTCYDLHRGWLKRDGALFYDPETVEVPAGKHERAFQVPAARLAKRAAGSPVVANVVALGHLVAKLGLFDLETLKTVVSKNVPARHVAANLKAVELGWNHEPPQSG